MESGGMMGKPNDYWDYENCFNEAKKYSTRGEFRKGSQVAYYKALHKKWIDDYTWLVYMKKPNNYYSYEKCYEEAKKYTSRGEFAKGNPSAYNNAWKNHWLDDYFWFSESASAKRWNYETCLEESKKYKTRTEFHDGSNSAYAVACRNKWLDEYIWLEDGNQKRVIWTYESCYQEAKKYKRISDFAKKSPGAYDAAIENKWRDDYTWLPHAKRWTYEEIFELAKQFEYKVDFYRNNCGAYDTALRNGWIDDFDWFLDGIKRTGEKHRKWYYETCYKEALKYKTRGEFGTKSSRAYWIAIQNGWIDDYDWLIDKRLDLYNDEIDCVYAYEFPKWHTVYVGRTLIERKKDRDREHLYVRNDAVAKFAIRHGIEVPLPIYLEDYLTIKEGVKKECYWIEMYKEQGWHLLNSKKGGSIGGLGKGKWNSKTCLAEAKKYKTIRDFLKNSPYAYQKATKHRWIENYVWLEDNIKHRKEYYTYEKCFEIAKKCNSLNEFRKEKYGAYNVAKENNWLDDYTWLERQFKWTEETLLEEAKKYKTRSEFSKMKPGAYEYALKHNLLDKCVWFIETQKPPGYWTYERCLEESKKYKYRGDYRTRSLGSYKVAYRKGWIEDFTWLQKQKPNIRRIWTKEKCREVAIKYKSVSEFKKENKSAYKAATRYKWLKEYTWFNNGQLSLFD